MNQESGFVVEFRYTEICKAEGQNYLLWYQLESNCVDKEWLCCSSECWSNRFSTFQIKGKISPASNRDRDKRNVKNNS